MKDHSPTFEIGEIAIFRRPEDKRGMEITILSVLHFQRWRDQRTGQICYGMAYQIDPGIPGKWVAEPHELHKRRPPQDWVSLCKLRWLPEELVEG